MAAASLPLAAAVRWNPKPCRLVRSISPLPSLRLLPCTSLPYTCPRPLRLPPGRPLGIGFRGLAAKDGGGGAAAADEAEARGRSTMPERFRHLVKEAPDRPVWWPWAVGLVFLVYTWRTVLWELSNWKKAMLAIVGFIGYLFKLFLAFIFHFIGDPLTCLIRCIEFGLYSARSIYASIVAFAPVPELTRIILLTSSVLAIAEATVPDSVNCQPYLLMLSGIIGFGAVRGLIPELLFWFLLLGMFCFSRYAKKKDDVSSALPSVAVLTAIGEPWVRVLTLAFYLALAIIQQFQSSEGGKHTEISANGRRLPVPLLLSALAIGINLSAKWIRHRHLTWMIS